MGKVFKGAKNLMFGRKQEPSTYKQAPMTRDQRIENKRRSRLFAKLEADINQPSDYRGIEADIAEQEDLARGAYEDQKRSLMDIIKQRGLGSSSVGLSQMTGLGQRFSENIARVRAQRQEMERARDMEKYGKTAGLFGMLNLQTPQGYMQQHAKRGGGLFGTAVEAAKAYAAVKGGGGGGK